MELNNSLDCFICCDILAVEETSSVNVQVLWIHSSQVKLTMCNS